MRQDDPWRKPASDMIQARTDRETGQPYAEVAGRKIPIPRSRIARLALGTGFIIGGLLAFLPVLGIWMIPLGLLVLSYDFPIARRLLRFVRKYVGRAWRAWRGRARREPPGSAGKS